jgi:hypothetical protein
MTFTTKAMLRGQLAKQDVREIEQSATIRTQETELTTLRAKYEFAERRNTELDRITKQQDRVIDQLRGNLASRDEQLRLEILSTVIGFGRESELGQFSGWVLNGTMPESQSYDGSTEPIKVDIPVTGKPPISRRVVEDAVDELVAVAERLDAVRSDPQLTVGKVRLQNIYRDLGWTIERLREGL